MDAFFAFAAGGALVIALEWTMWRLFLRRIEGIHFPRETDMSYFRFFSIGRVRLCALAHTAFLLSALGLSLFFLW